MGTGGFDLGNFLCYTWDNGEEADEILGLLFDIVGFTCALSGQGLVLHFNRRGEHSCTSKISPRLSRRCPSSSRLRSLRILRLSRRKSRTMCSKHSVTSCTRFRRSL